MGTGAILDDRARARIEVVSSIVSQPALPELCQDLSDKLGAFVNFDRLILLDGQIDDIEFAFLAESALRRRQIHQGKTAAEDRRRPLLLEQRAHCEFAPALAGEQNDFCPY